MEPGENATGEKMEPCPQCGTILEPWEVTCHGCGKVVSLAAVPVVFPAGAPAEDLEDAFHSWFGRGRESLEKGSYENAAACFQEALKRLTGLNGGRAREVEVRLLLAESLERSDKLAEAARQYRLSGESAESDERRGELLTRAEELSKRAVDLTLLTTDEYRQLEGNEAAFVPLYCSGCKRLLNEGEVFGFRRGKVLLVRCLCGHEGKPLAKLDAKHERAVREAEQVRGRKAQLLKAADQEFPAGKKKAIAAWLALLLGDFGIHKLYLGERAAFFIYLMLSWTLLPWIVSVFEAVSLFSMSRVTFNLTYNVDLLLASIPAEPVPMETHSEQFSMEITYDPEDYLDELSGTEALPPAD